MKAQEQTDAELEDIKGELSDFDAQNSLNEDDELFRTQLLSDQHELK